MRPDGDGRMVVPDLFFASLMIRTTTHSQYCSELLATMTMNYVGVSRNISVFRNYYWYDDDNDDWLLDLVKEDPLYEPSED